MTMTIAISGCSDYIDKKVFEPLTIEELKRSIDEETTFQRTYKTIQHIKDAVLKSDNGKARFAELTYNRVFNLIRFSQDTIYFEAVREQLKKEWRDKYGILQHKVDSISDYWKKYKDENSLGQYIKIELVQIDKEYNNACSFGIRNVNLGFRLTPLNGQVDQLRFGYRIEAKINEKKDESLNEFFYSRVDMSWCSTTTPVSKPIVIYWKANCTNEKILKSKTVETFFKDHNIYIEVNQIRKGGINLSNNDLKIPESIKNHWKYENSEYLKDFYAKDVLKDLLNIEYVPEHQYIFEGVSKKLKDKDALAFEFLNALGKKGDE